MNDTAARKLLLALEELLLHKALDAIRVSEICARAGVCRKTFYRNYTDKYALAACYFEQVFSESFGRLSEGECFDTALLTYLELCEAHAAIFRNAYSSMDVNGLRSIDINCTRTTYQTFLARQGADISDSTIRFAIEIAARGGADMVIEWLKNGCSMDKQEFCALIKRTLPADLARYL